MSWSVFFEIFVFDPTHAGRLPRCSIFRTRVPRGASNSSRFVHSNLGQAHRHHAISRVAHRGRFRCLVRFPIDTTRGLCDKCQRQCQCQ